MRREVVSTAGPEALGEVLAELIQRVNDLSVKNGFPPLRSRTVLAIPDDQNPGVS